MNSRPRSFSRSSRPGTIYVLVLMTTLIVAILGLSAVALSRIQLRRERQAHDAASARAAARAAIEWGFMKIRLETNWNNLLTGNPQWATNVRFEGGSYSLTMLLFDNADPVNPETLFDREWALALLERVMAQLQAECVRESKEALFEATKGFLTGAGPESGHAGVAQELGMEEGAVRVAVHRMRKRYRQLLRDEIAQTLSDPAGVEEELRSLREALG